MPDTYYFERGDTRQSLLDAHGEDARGSRSTRSGRVARRTCRSNLPAKMVTLASIVSKSEDRARPKKLTARFAGVFVNRLQKHMRLESDPTIVYGFGLGQGHAWPQHHEGRSQSVDALQHLHRRWPTAWAHLQPWQGWRFEAVANPARGKDLYFVADGTGGHVFAETLGDQHLKNVAHWRQIEKRTSSDKLAPDVTPVESRPRPRSGAPLNSSIRRSSARSPRPRRDDRLPGAVLARLLPKSALTGAQRDAALRRRWPLTASQVDRGAPGPSSLASTTGLRKGRPSPTQTLQGWGWTRSPPSRSRRPCSRSRGRVRPSMERRPRH